MLQMTPPHDSFARLSRDTVCLDQCVAYSTGAWLRERLVLRSGSPEASLESATRNDVDAEEEIDAIGEEPGGQRKQFP